MKRLGIDCDGVVCDFVQAFYRTANPMFGTDFGGPQRTWDFEDEFSKEQVDAVWDRIKRTRDFWQTLRPMEGIRGLRNLPKNVEPVFITSRIPTLGHSVHDQSCHWLRQNLYITYPMVIVVEHPAEKIPLCKNLGIESFIDDRRETIILFYEAGIRSYCKLAPYNSAKPYPEGVRIVESVDEYLKEELTNR